MCGVSVTPGVVHSGSSAGSGSRRCTSSAAPDSWPLSIAPSSLTVETRPATTEIWIGALAGEMLVQLTLANNCVVREQRLLKKQLGRIRDVRVDPSGAVYVLTDGGEGMLYRIELPESEIMQGSGPY